MQLVQIDGIEAQNRHLDLSKYKKAGLSVFGIGLLFLLISFFQSLLTNESLNISKESLRISKSSDRKSFWANIISLISIIISSVSAIVAIISLIISYKVMKKK